jgi:two-component system sensor histidine kinase CpxA
VCYWLALHITKPVIQIQAASRRLANGDLSARVSTKLLLARGDELSDLGRDFDAMATRLEVLVTAQRRLIADISHELGSPLTRVSVALGLARRKAGGLLETELTRIELETGRLNQLIQELLDLASIESEGPPRDTVQFDLRALVEDITNDADFEASAVDKRVVCEASATIALRGSPARLRRAIENVVRNAVRHTAAKTEVRIRLEQNAETKQAIIRVSDCGPGVPESELKHIFTPFYRVSKSREAKSGGAGLGLAIAQRAIESHGGLIQACNMVGGGLEISIFLPITNAAQGNCSGD